VSRTVLVTGASSGIGLATAVAAGRAGFTAVGTVRDPGRAGALRAAAAAAGVAVDVAVLDVSDPESISDCVRTVLARHGRLDALVNNAGVAGSNRTLELCDLAELRAAMEVNFFGVVALSRAAMPHLRAAGGRLVTVGSVRGVIGQPFNEGYSATKFAVEGFMEALAPVAARVGVRVCVVEPAAVADTAFVDSSPDPDVATLLAGAGPYEPAFRAYRDWVGTGAVRGAQVPRDVAAVVVAALTAPDPPFRIPTSDHARDHLARKLADPDGSAVQALTASWVAGPLSSARAPLEL
jgi:NAD(P)-dependent dehydrogenase (short-subunit alcohol dehydrogenase family)